MNAYNHAEFNLTHKRSEIDAQERRLIDEAIAAGKVEKIPTGKSAFAEDYVWEGDRNSSHGVGKLVSVVPRTFKERKARYNKAWGRRNSLNPETIRVREEVLRLTKQGLSYSQVGEALNISKRSVNSHCQALRKAGRLELRSSNGMTVAEVQARREDVLKHLNEGLSYREVGKLLGVSKNIVQSDKEFLAQSFMGSGWR